MKQSSYDDEECPVDPPQPSDPLNEGNCDYCLQTAENNKKGEQEEFLVCKDCSAKGTETDLIKLYLHAHLFCVQFFINGYILF